MEKCRFKFLKFNEVLTPILIFLLIQIISLALLNSNSEISKLFFELLTNLLFVNSFSIYIIIVFSKILDELTRTYFLEKNSKKIFFDEDTIKKMLAFLGIALFATTIYIESFFKVIEFQTHFPLFLSIAILVGILKGLLPTIFIILLVYLATYKKNKIDQLFLTFNIWIYQILNDNKYFEVKQNSQEFEKENEFNVLINTYMNNKNKNVELIINIFHTEFWNNLKKGTIPPNIIF